MDISIQLFWYKACLMIEKTNNEMTNKIYWKTMPIMALVLLSMFGCIKDEETNEERQVKLDDELVQQYIENNNIEAERDATGFYYAPITSNSSGKTIATKDIVVLKYKISLLSGTLIEDKTDTVYKVMHNVIPGIFSQTFNRSLNPYGVDLGLAYMKEGEKFMFIVPSYLAYYNYTNNGKLSAYSNLLAEVEVIDIISEADQKLIEKDSIDAYIERKPLVNVTPRASGLHYVKTEEGTGQTPNAGQVVKVTYKGYLLDGTVFDSSTATTPFISFEIGKDQVIPGWDEGIALMKEGEKGILIIPSHLAYYQSVFTLPVSMNSTKIPPFSVLIFDVELVDIQ